MTVEVIPADDIEIPDTGLLLNFFKMEYAEWCQRAPDMAIYASESMEDVQVGHHPAIGYWLIVKMNDEDALMSFMPEVPDDEDDQDEV